MCEVTGFLLVQVLGDSVPGFLPMPQFDQFEYLDKPLVDADGLRRLAREWKSADSEFHAYSQWPLEDYFAEFPNYASPKQPTPPE